MEALNSKLITDNSKLLVALAFTLLAIVTAQADSSSTQDLAAQVRDILRKHCFECHGTNGQPKGELQILDHSTLIQRKLVLPRSADHSELFLLIRDGNMPPGTRPKLIEAERAVLRKWIEMGAAPFPKERGEAYVSSRILKDVAKLPKEIREFARYVSLNHLLKGDAWGVVEDESSSAEIARQRKAVSDALKRLTQKGEDVELVPIDRTGTIFRYDLRILDRQEFMSENSPIQVEIAATDPDTRREQSVFKPGDQLQLRLGNPSDKPIRVELIVKSIEGKVWMPALPNPILKVGQKLLFTPVTISTRLGKESVSVYACLAEAPPAATSPTALFYKVSAAGDRLEPSFDPASVVKRTIVIETR